MVYGNQAARQYRAVDTGSIVLEADPHRLIQMLFDGALERLALAKGFLHNGEIAGRLQAVNGAIAIIDGLHGALDMERGGALASQLDQLYRYMNRRLVEANLHRDASIIEEVAHLLRELKEGWDGIRPLALAAQPA
ncbi:MAG: flagellar export chaperone FliS [Pseudomonadales bacterium]|jgi:flagellar protein FliS|nr:flagellar export chaperone FliS [Pseudomonadales bacterium]MCC6530790.1 flagellar export chaperone FliS [Pseudomonadales bacterium]MCP5333626.1 flagellar export chaperone FliS [Pseudomonadales bacterium]HQN41179.1 flagellar export chaperone FliS [Pseudomonadales bacterium]